MFKFDNPKKSTLVLIFLFLPMLPAFSGEFGLEAGTGPGFWSGDGSRSVEEAYTSLGLDTGSLLVAAASAAGFYRGSPFLGPACFFGTAGLGLWSGSVGGRQAGDLERASSTLAFALELVPGIEAAFPLTRGRLLTQLRLGIGFIMGPVVTIDVLPGLRSVSEVPPEFLNRFIAIGGVGIGYQPGASLAFLLRAEGALADFDAAAGSAPTRMGRLHLVVQYTFHLKGVEP